MTNHSIHIKTELVNGKCPNCNEESILISLASQYYKCTICNHTLEQKDQIKETKHNCQTFFSTDFDN